MNNIVYRPVKAVRLEDLTTEQANRIANSIVENWNDWRTQRYGIERVWNSIDNQVNQYDPVYSPQTDSDVGFKVQLRHGFGQKIKFPHTFSHREGLVASFMRYLMEDDYDFFTPVPLDSVDTELTDGLKQYLMYLLDLTDFENRLAPFVRDAAQYGTAFAAYEWHRITAPQWKRERLTDPITKLDMGVVDMEQQVTLVDAPIFTPLNVYNTVIDPSDPNTKTSTLIMAKAVSPYEIRANQNYPQVVRDNWDAIVGAPAFEVSPQQNMDESRERARGNSSYSASQTYKDKKLVYEAWGQFSDGKELYVNYVAEVFNGKLIRFEPNPYNMPYKPFIVCSPLKETNRVYGPSLLFTVRGIQAAFDTTYNQFHDAWDIELNAPTLVQANSIIQSTRHRQNTVVVPPMAKDAFWLVRDIQTSVGKMPTNNVAGRMNPAPMLQLLAGAMEMGTGDNPLNSGGQAPEYMKTGVAMTIANAGNDRLNLYAKAIERDCIVPMLEMTVRYIQQNVDTPRTFKRLDNFQTALFDPAVAAQDIRFTMRGASYNMNRQQQTNNFLNAIREMLGSPLAQVFNPGKLAVQVLKMVGAKNPLELLNPEAVMMAENAVQQPTFSQRIMGLFGKKQVQQQQEAGSEFNGFLPGVSDAAGGTSEAFGSSPFNFSQPGRATGGSN